MKAHQRKIREQIAEKRNAPKTSIFFDNQAYPDADIKKAILRPITYKEAEAVILEYEWLGTMGTTQYHYGIFFGSHIAGAVCFGYFQAMEGYSTYVGDEYAKKGIQLSRGACVHWSHPHSGSKLIAYGLREMKKLGYKYVIAFSDPEAGEIGTLYQATNWYYLGVATKGIHWNIHYCKGHKSGKVYMNDRDIYKKYGFCGRQQILDNIVQNRDDIEVVASRPKARYIKLIGSKKENKEMLSFLQDKIKPYPKRS